jgi:hypothetical protein
MTPRINLAPNLDLVLSRAHLAIHCVRIGDADYARGWAALAVHALRYRPGQWTLGSLVTEVLK